MAFIEGLGMGGHDSDSELSDGVGDEDSNEEMSISTQATRLTPLAGGGYQDISIPSPQGIAPLQTMTASLDSMGQGLGQGLGHGQESTSARSTTPFHGENLAITPRSNDSPIISVPSPGSHTDTPMTDAGDDLSTYLPTSIDVNIMDIDVLCRY